MHGLLLRSSNSEDGKCGEDRVPVPLAEVVGNVVHVPSGRWPPELGIELLGRFNKVACQVGLVRALNLVQVSVR